LATAARQRAGRSGYGLHAQVGQEAQPPEQIGVQRVGQRHHERVVAQHQRQHALARGQCRRHAGHGLGLRRQQARVHQPARHQRSAQVWLAAAACAVQRLPQALAGADGVRRRQGVRRCHGRRWGFSGGGIGRNYPLNCPRTRQ
jgi:hypothetical protein